MSLRSSLFILTFLLTSLLPRGAYALASGEVNGQMIYGMAQYRAEVDGEEVRSVQTNYQQVALRYARQGVVGDARAGRYTLMLGYEFNRVAPTVTNSGVRDPSYEEIRAKKLFYDGEILLAPGGLPFRLSLFARDLHQTAFVDEGKMSSLPVGLQGGNQQSLINPQLFTGVQNGTHRQFGGTLLIGIRNGSYLGSYRDILSQLPRLLIDYNQIEVRDLASDRNQQYYRSRDIAFISLNKKDNWIHYRMRDYTDFLSPGNNSSHKQVLIGAIDQAMDRKWINLTNWLKISGDLSYSVDKEVKTAGAEQIYLVNMMALGQRQGVNTSLLSQFSRQSDGRTITLTTDLPMSMTADLSRDTRFRSRFIYQAQERSLFAGEVLSSEDAIRPGANVGQNDRDCYLDLQLELQRSRPILVVPRFEFESRSQLNGEGMAVRVGAEISSNKRQMKSFDWLGGYALMTTHTDETFLDRSGSYLQNEIYGRVDKDLNQTFRVGGNGNLATGSGTGQSVLVFRIPRMATQLRVGGGNGGQVVDSSYNNTVTSGYFSLYLEHRYQQLENRFEFGHDFVTAAGVTVQQDSLSHRLAYSRAAHKLGWESVVNVGDNSGSTTVNSDYLGGNNTGNITARASWQSTARYSYDPNRSIGFNLNGAVSGVKTDQQRTTYALSERLAYRIYTTNGIVRRIAEFSEEVGYEKVGQDFNGRGNSLYGKFSAAYFPTRYLYGKLRTEIVRFPSNGGQQQVNSGEVGADFEKLKVIVSYTEGNKSRESVILPEVRERLWDLKVKKIF